ncbi:MAG: nitrilase-related carbon-nitrogen hydrolase [bacterium]|jgi:N-carbamoylputrescine amidase
MTRTVKCALIQTGCPGASGEIEAVKEAMISKQIPMIERAAYRGSNIVCLQELFYSPYFPAGEDLRWLEVAESVPGETTARMGDLAKRLGIVLIVPIAETAGGKCFNTAVVMGTDGAVKGKYRKVHLPDLVGFREKFYFEPGDMGYPVFETEFARLGIYVCYDRHFPEGARALGLKGAEIVFNPSATIEGLSRHLWDIEQRGHAVANGYFVGALNRVGREKPWESGKFYGSSYFCDPAGKVLAKGSDSGDDIVVADLDLSMIESVRDLWHFYEGRRPETYGDLVKPPQ